MQEVYNRRMQTMIEKANPIVKQIYEKNSPIADDTPVTVPITDGKRLLNLPVNLKKAYESESKEIVKALCRAIILYQIDEYWKQHLRDMDDLRQSVQNAAYEQKDPLVVYKLESYNLFSQMLEELNEAVLTFLLRAFIPLRDANEAQAPRQAAPQPRRAEHAVLQTVAKGLAEMVSHGREPPGINLLHGLPPSSSHILQGINRVEHSLRPLHIISGCYGVHGHHMQSLLHGSFP